MKKIVPAADAEGESGQNTLGALLQVGRVEPSVPESEWVVLLQGIAKGDQAALRELYGRMSPLVFTAIFRVVQDKQTAEELTIDVFHQIWKRAGFYPPEGQSVVGWVMNQARSRAIDQLRFQGRKKRVNTFPADSDAQDDDLEGAIDQSHLDRQLRDAVARLAPHERSAIEMAYFSDCSYAEVATRLGQPTGTVKTRIRTGLEKLRQALAPDGDT